VLARPQGACYALTLHCYKQQLRHDVYQSIAHIKPHQKVLHAVNGLVYQITLFKCETAMVSMLGRSSAQPSPAGLITQGNPTEDSCAMVLVVRCIPTTCNIFYIRRCGPRLRVLKLLAELQSSSNAVRAASHGQELPADELSSQHCLACLTDVICDFRGASP
jgi:hypothetical protein